MPPKILKYEKSCECLYGAMKALDLSKPASKKLFMDLIGTFLKDQPIEKKEVPDTLPIPVDLPSIKKKKKRATARKPKESENEEGEAKAKKKTVIAPVPEKKAKKSTKKAAHYQ